MLTSKRKAFRTEPNNCSINRRTSNFGSMKVFEQGTAESQNRIQTYGSYSGWNVTDLRGHSGFYVAWKL